MAGAAGLEVLWASRLAEAVEGRQTPARRPHPHLLRGARLRPVQAHGGARRPLDVVLRLHARQSAALRGRVDSRRERTSRSASGSAARPRGSSSRRTCSNAAARRVRRRSRAGSTRSFRSSAAGPATGRRSPTRPPILPTRSSSSRSARQTYQRGGGALAEARFQRLARDPKTSPPRSKEQVARHTSTSLEMESGRFDEAVAAPRHAHRHRAGSRAQDARRAAPGRRGDRARPEGPRDLAPEGVRESPSGYSSRGRGAGAPRRAAGEGPARPTKVH